MPESRKYLDDLADRTKACPHLRVGSIAMCGESARMRKEAKQISMGDILLVPDFTRAFS